MFWSLRRRKSKAIAYCRFYPSKVYKIIEAVISDKLKTHVYDPNNTPLLSEDLVRIIRGKIKAGIYGLQITRVEDASL
jgi:hypothetical protein